jgi:rhodanese-related sulfurtransferase
MKTVSAAELHDWIKEGRAVIVDVREPSEYEAGHIAGVTLLPLAQVTQAALPPHQGRKLVMQCRSGGRSGKACQKLTEEDAGIEVYNLEGGILGWIEAGYAVEKGA